MGFVAATVALAALVASAHVTAGERARARRGGAVFAGLLVSYALAITTGLPLLHPDPEPVDGLALATKAIEAVGLLTASSLLWRRRLAVHLQQPKGTLT